MKAADNCRGRDARGLTTRASTGDGALGREKYKGDAFLNLDEVSKVWLSDLSRGPLSRLRSASAVGREMFSFAKAPVPSSSHSIKKHGLRHACARRGETRICGLVGDTQHRQKSQDKAMSESKYRSGNEETTWNFPGGSNGLEVDRSVERGRMQSGSITSRTD